jgi:hypothetical protein
MQGVVEYIEIKLYPLSSSSSRLAVVGNWILLGREVLEAVGVSPPWRVCGTLCGGPFHLLYRFLRFCSAVVARGKARHAEEGGSSPFVKRGLHLLGRSLAAFTYLACHGGKKMGASMRRATGARRRLCGVSGVSSPCSIVQATTTNCRRYPGPRGWPRRVWQRLLRELFFPP